MSQHLDDVPAPLIAVFLAYLVIFTIGRGDIFGRLIKGLGFKGERLNGAEG
jgi:hypothetical protein